MTNPFARSLIIAARLDRAVPPATMASAGEPRPKRWDAPRHWLSRPGQRG